MSSPIKHLEPINMTDKELIGYCEIHCETERALFRGDYIIRMCELAGVVTDGIKPAHFYTMHQHMKDLCKSARKNLKEKNND